MMFFDFPFSQRKRAGSSALAERYQSRASHLRTEAVAPGNLKRRSLLLFAAWEYELLADRMVEAAKVERIKITEARAADRRRRHADAGVRYSGRARWR